MSWISSEIARHSFLLCQIGGKLPEPSTFCKSPFFRRVVCRCLTQRFPRKHQYKANIQHHRLALSRFFHNCNSPYFQRKLNRICRNFHQLHALHLWRNSFHLFSIFKICRYGFLGQKHPKPPPWSKVFEAPKKRGFRKAFRFHFGFWILSDGSHFWPMDYVVGMLENTLQCRWNKGCFQLVRIILAIHGVCWTSYNFELDLSWICINLHQVAFEYIQWRSMLYHFKGWIMLSPLVWFLRIWIIDSGYNLEVASRGLQGKCQCQAAKTMKYKGCMHNWQRLQLAVSEYASPANKPSNHPTNQFTTHKIHSLPKWADCLTKKINLPTNHQVPKLLILRPTPTLQGRHSNKAHQSSSVHAVHSRGPWVAPL